MNDINYAGALLAGLATLAVGAIWYSPSAFGDAWASRVGLVVKPRRSAMARTFALGYIISVVISIGLSAILGPPVSLLQYATSSMAIGAICVGGSLAINNLFGGRPATLTAIELGYVTIQFACFGAILALIG